MERLKVAIVGSGPGGLSAAARAAKLGLSHVLLEREPKHADTIQKYARGKFVMATPDILPRRSDMSFETSSRETVLDTWAEEIKSAYRRSSGYPASQRAVHVASDRAMAP